MTPDEQRIQDAAHRLWHAQQHLAEYKGDVPGQVDLVIAVRKADKAFVEAGGTAEDYRRHITRQHAEAERNREAAREQAYERTGVVPQ